MKIRILDIGHRVPAVPAGTQEVRGYNILVITAAAAK